MHSILAALELDKKFLDKFGVNSERSFKLMIRYSSSKNDVYYNTWGESYNIGHKQLQLIGEHTWAIYFYVAITSHTVCYILRETSFLECGVLSITQIFFRVFLAKFWFKICEKILERLQGKSTVSFKEFWEEKLLRQTIASPTLGSLLLHHHVAQQNRAPPSNLPPIIIVPKPANIKQ